MTIGARHERLVVPAIVAIALLIWIPLFRRPFLLDETGIAWNIAGGAGSIVERIFHGLPQSILYSYVLWLASLPFGPQEWALRLPSLIASIGTLLILYRIARRRLAPESAVAAAMVPLVWLLITRPFSIAITARPYAMGMFFGALALDCCLEWVEKRDRKSLVILAVAAVAPFYFSFMFGLTLAAYAIFLVWMRRRDGLIGWRGIGGVILLWVVLMLPLAGHVLAVGGTGGLHSMRMRPVDAADLLFALAPVELLACHALALAITLLRRRRTPGGIPWTATALAGMVAVAVLVPLLAATKLANVMLWVQRYYSVAFPALAMVHGVVFARKYDRAAACCAIVAALAVAGSRPFLVDYVREPQSYETIVHAIRKERQPGTAIYLRSQFVEGLRYRFPVERYHRDWLLAPFLYYQLEEPFEIVPHSLEQCDGDFADTLLTSMSAHRRFLLVSHKEVPLWVARAAAGFRTRMVVRSADYRLDVYERDDPAR